MNVHARHVLHCKVLAPPQIERTLLEVMAKIDVYTTDYCPYCTRAKALLAKRGIAFDEIDVGGNTAKRQWLVAASGGRKTVPQIFINGVPVGGYDELAALDRSGDLAKMAGGTGGAPPAKI